jgi:outer membrane receptor protein involved in Fe transport
MRQIRLQFVVKAAVLAAAALFVPRFAEAQTGKLTGVITDAQSGQPIEGVQVQVQGTGLGALTQANGRYYIISVPPGRYTVVARRIGYQPAEQVGTDIRIDVTRTVDFQLNSAAGQLTVQRIVAPPTPLVERGITGSSQSVSSEVIEALPVTSVSDILQLQQGFLQVPENTDITSFTESRRNTQNVLRIRGGRGDQTLTLIDGIPISNWVFGGPAFDLTNSAISQIDFQKGGFEPQYGNALSGIINIATREAGTRLAGNVEYQGSGFAGKLGSTQDDLRQYDLFRGYVSGPIPATNNKLRFVLAGQNKSGADNVLEFDQDVYDADNLRTIGLLPEQLDLFPGWRALGYDQERSIFGKLTFQPMNQTTINGTVIDYSRDRQRFDFDYLLAGFDPFRSPSVNTQADTLALAGFRGYRDIVAGSIRAERRLYSASLEQRFNRSNVRLRYGRFEQSRNTCNYFQGVCLARRFADVNFNDRFVATGTTAGEPTTGTDQFYGGETVESNIIRADIESQVTDRHNLQGGVFWQKHNLEFDEARNIGVNVLFLQPQKYRAYPYDAAAYIQDRIEYDFLTVKLGFRFDYGKAEGSSFANPLDPTNGTTAREVCLGTAPSVGATTPFSYTDATGTYTGLDACGIEAARAEAAKIAQGDDFEDAKPRKAFSPRIGISFPLNERSSLFFNAGRYSQNPIYNSLYQNTGVGTVAGPGGGVCSEEARRPNSIECTPTLINDLGTPGFIGNPSLLLEQSTQYEVGYAAELGQRYAINLTFFAKDNTGLSGIRRSNRVQDIGTTYAGQANPTYTVLVNQDYQTSRGIEIQFRRRLANFWGYDINYSYSKATENSSPPDRAEERSNEGDPNQITEITADIDQPHVFNASLLFRVDDQAPSFRFGNLLKHTNLTTTVRAFSGLPYTPTRDFLAFAVDEVGRVNSARGPSSLIVDMQAGKDFRVGNVRYGLFTQVKNVLDAKNCVQVYPTTGRCDAGVIDQRRSRQGNSVGQLTSSTFYDRPEYYGARRSINAGIRATF